MKNTFTRIRMYSLFGIFMLFGLSNMLLASAVEGPKEVPPIMV